MASARAARDQAQLDLERTEVRAPFDGRIRQTMADQGQFIGPGTPVADVYEDTLAQVRLPLTDAQAALLNLPFGDELTQAAQPSVTLHGRALGEDHQWSARLVRTEASLDPQSRMLYAVAELPEPFNTERHGAPLLMGSFVTAEIEGKPLTDIVSLPITAVFQRDRLYSVSENGEVVEKQVRVLTIEGERIWVKGDLWDGEPVITDRQAMSARVCRSGLPVRRSQPQSLLKTKTSRRSRRLRAAYEPVDSVVCRESGGCQPPDGVDLHWRVSEH